MRQVTKKFVEGIHVLLVKLACKFTVLKTSSIIFSTHEFISITMPDFALQSVVPEHVAMLSYPVHAASTPSLSVLHTVFQHA